MVELLERKLELELLERKRLEFDDTEDTRTQASPGYRHTKRKDASG